MAFARERFAMSARRIATYAVCVIVSILLHAGWRAMTR